MKTYLALFRGINVGGKNILLMKDLVALLKNLGSQNVKTYIQSGNAVFQHSATGTATLSNKISAAIKAGHGFEPQVLLLEKIDLERAIAANPFREAESDPKSLHLFFLASVPENPDLKELERIKSENEQFKLVGTVFYLHAPGGIGNSKLAVRVEKSLGVATTARNWRSVCKIMEMVKQSG